MKSYIATDPRTLRLRMVAHQARHDEHPMLSPTEGIDLDSLLDELHRLNVLISSAHNRHEALAATGKPSPWLRYCFPLKPGDDCQAKPHGKKKPTTPGKKAHR
jgi:hypothetical protein